MVAADVVAKGDGSDVGVTTTQKAEGLPAGKYKLVGWDLDLTGRRLRDEIVQIAAYTPENQFSQYVMPNRDLSIQARRRHQLKVVTVFKYRVLKQIKKNKRVSTKSEISSLIDFVSWLEANKGSGNDGIILVCHEQVNCCPALLLSSLGKYPHANLLERFKSVVSGFANGFQIAEQKCAKTVNQFKLKTLSSVLLGKDEAIGNAAVRARLAYQVLQQVCAPEEGAENSAGAGDAATPNMSQLVASVRQYSHPVSSEEEQLAILKALVKKQDGLRPVFDYLLRSQQRPAREKAYSLRTLLVNGNINLNDLTNAWNDGQKEAVSKLLQQKVEEKDQEELLQIIESHFVPELRPKQEKPIQKKPRKIRKRKYSKTNGATASSSDESADATRENHEEEKSPSQEESPKKEDCQESTEDGKESSPKSPKESPTKKEGSPKKESSNDTVVKKAPSNETSSKKEPEKESPKDEAKESSSKREAKESSLKKDFVKDVSPKKDFKGSFNKRERKERSPKKEYVKGGSPKKEPSPKEETVKEASPKRESITEETPKKELIKESPEKGSPKSDHSPKKNTPNRRSRRSSKKSESHDSPKNTEAIAY